MQGNQDSGPSQLPLRAQTPIMTSSSWVSRLTFLGLQLFPVKQEVTLGREGEEKERGRNRD